MRLIVTGVLIGTLAGGCGPTLRQPHDHGGGGMVDEYRPTWRPVERRAPASADYVLWGWHRATTRPGVAGEFVQPARWEHAAQVVHAYVRVGEPIGFRKRQADGQLLAVAGRRARPLPAGHYCWHMRPGNPSDDVRVGQPGQFGRDLGRAAEATAKVAGVVLVVGLVVAVVYFAAREEHHHHRHDDCNDDGFMIDLSGD